MDRLVTVHAPAKISFMLPSELVFYRPVKFLFYLFIFFSAFLSGSGTSRTLPDDSAKAKHPYAPRYKSYQDSTFARAERMHISPRNLFFPFFRVPMTIEDLDRVNAYFAEMRNLPDSLFKPSTKELYQQQLRTFGALAPPFPVPFSPGTGISIPLSTIGQFFGLSQDVSPTLHYTLREPSLVKVNVYTPDGELLLAALSDLQTSGNHLFVWDGTLADGRRAPRGDYILELAIGSLQLRTKLVQL